jgi:hypothetical protein
MKIITNSYSKFYKTMPKANLIAILFILFSSVISTSYANTKSTSNTFVDLNYALSIMNKNQDNNDDAYQDNNDRSYTENDAFGLGFGIQKKFLAKLLIGSGSIDVKLKVQDKDIVMDYAVSGNVMLGVGLPDFFYGYAKVGFGTAKISAKIASVSETSSTISGEIGLLFSPDKPFNFYLGLEVIMFTKLTNDLAPFIGLKTGLRILF